MQFVYVVASSMLVIIFGASVSWLQGIGCSLAFLATSILAYAFYGYFAEMSGPHAPGKIMIGLSVLFGTFLGIGLIKVLIFVWWVIRPVSQSDLIGAWGGSMGALGVLTGYASRRFLPE